MNSDPPRDIIERRIVQDVQQHPQRYAIAGRQKALRQKDPEALSREDRKVLRTRVRQFPKFGRNEPCPCGSGRKYKVCHMANAEPHR